MKQARYLSIWILTFLLAASCTVNKKGAGSKSEIIPLSDTVSVREGTIIYGLPRSVFTVVVEMERTVEIPGPYAKYAQDLLGLEKVIQSESESWAVKGVTVKTSEELDPSEYYIIESNTLFQTNVLVLKKQGLILDLNPKLYYSGHDQELINQFRTGQVSSFDLGSDEYFQLQRDTAFRRVTVDSSFIKIPYIVEKKKKLTVDQLAEKAARRLMEMRDGKHLILTGEATVFPQSDAPIIEMNQLEKELTELFVGKTITESRKFSYVVIPTKEMIGKPAILFRFSEQTGPISGTGQSGKQVTIDFIPEQKMKDLTIISKPHTEKDAPVYDKLFYRVPDVVNIKVSLGSDVLLSSRRLVYQFGQVVQLPQNYIIGK